MTELKVQSVSCGTLLKLYPKFTFLNYSCESNVSKYFIGDLMVVQASKNIKKGEEVTLITKKRIRMTT